MKIHPLAELFPPMPPKQFAELKADIKQHGVREAIWLYQKMILDGVHRARVCEELGIKCPTRKYTGNDPLAFVTSMNFVRRHLTTSQRALIASKVANMRQGERNDLEPSSILKKVSQEEAAKLMHVSEPLVSKASVIRREAPELIPEIEAGELTITKAYRQVRPPEAIDEFETDTEDQTDDDRYDIDETDNSDHPWENWYQLLDDILTDLLTVLDGFERNGGLDIATESWTLSEKKRFLTQFDTLLAQFQSFRNEFSAMCDTLTIDRET